jgi:hypothetical protein
MGLKQLSGEELRAVREAAVARFLSIAEKIKDEAGVHIHKIREKKLTGVAFVDQALIVAPAGKTRKQLYILAHECAHIALKHGDDKPRAQKEHEAELWAHEALRRHGVPVPKASTSEARDYVKRRINDGRTNKKSISPEAKRFARWRDEQQK